jgi:Mce-associated membrane protein
MLMALQGQRGANANDLKFITATVRVEFDRVAGQWRVNDLKVLKKPLFQGAPQ